jgi:hypothetical protein
MDDQSKNTQGQQSAAQSDPTQGGTLVQFPQTNSDTSQTPVQPPEPTGSALQKEQEPFPSKPLVPEITASEPTVEIAPDLEAAGMKDVAQVPDITEELKKAGVQAVSDHMQAPPLQKEMLLKSPIDEQKAETITKGSFLFKNPSSSLLWLALLVLRQLKMKKKEEKS